MRLRLRPLLSLLLLAAARANPAFDTWADAFTAEWARSNPQFATQAQYFSGAEQDALDRQLTLAGPWGNTFGQKMADQRAALARRGLEELKRFPATSLTASQRTSAALITWALNDTITAAQFARHRYLFDQFTGLHVGLVNFLTNTHPIRNRRDVENYLVRLERVAPVIEEGIAEARAAAEAGILPPRFIVERTIEQIDGMLLHPARENVFVATLATRVGLLGEKISAGDRQAFVAAAEKLVADAVIPAYRRVRALLAEQLPRTNHDAGVWRLPRGADFYRSALATYTTTRLDPDEIHAIGLREVARLEAEMDKTLRALGYTEGSVKDRYPKLSDASQPPGDPDPRAQLLADNVRFVADAEKRCDALFDLRPRAPVIVKREPPFTERTTAAHYTAPAPDGSQPGIYWLPLPGPKFDVLGMRSLSYHEAVPGHHFQTALQQESADLPRFRKLAAFGFLSAYGEGWALYAERLADESNWYDGDPRGRLGCLNSQLFRARRLVVDTGLHAKKWTRQQAIDFGIAPTEVERYVVWPGQACSYMIGQLRIVELREKARAALGANFSIKQFHNTVLRTGNVPLDVLAQEVDAWIASAKATGGSAAAGNTSVDPRDLPAPKRVVVPKLRGPLTIDGELSEPAWAQAAKLGPFLLANGSREEREPTIVRAWYDDTALYLAWTCTDSDIQQTFTARDSKFWEEEVAEFFITPKDLTRYFELQWNALGGVFDAIITNQLDERGVSKKFEGDWSYTAKGMKSAVKLRGTPANGADRDEFWQVEVMIPWSDFGVAAPKAGDVWRANFYRFNRGNNLPVEECAWSPPMLRGFHQPSRFGFLEFGK